MNDDDDEDDDVIKEHAGERDTERKKNEGQNYMSTIENESQAKKKRERKILDRTMQSLNDNNNNDND